MKKILRFWIWLFLFSLFSATTSAQVQRFVPKQEALSIAQGQFRGQDVDYYILDDSTSSTWNIFVDAEPMKGWQHDSYIIKVPKLLGPNSGPIQTIQQKNPPLGNYVPLLVKNRYGGYANSKPHVAKPVSSNEPNEAAQRTYAIILSGGVNKLYNYERYWNDCSFIYQTLVNKHGIPKGNIIPIMSDGNDPAADMNCTMGGFKSQSLDLDFDGIPDISLAATKPNVRKALNSLANKMRKDDHLFVFVIDHGGSDDDISKSYICLWNGERLYDEELALMLKPFTSRLVNVNVVLGQCYAGGFNDNLEMVGCVVASAAQGNESSWACPDIPYDEFVYQWTCAVNGATHTGEPVVADGDRNGRVTMQEAFEYAELNDRQKNWETPQYTSTPLSVGEDLAFNHLAPSVDLFIQDNLGDTGKEPNTTIEEFWKSPSIWVRNYPDGEYGHQNPMYSSEHPTAYVYVRVHNRGKEKFDGKNKWVALYWAKASTGISPDVWKGRETDENGELTGKNIDVLPIGSIEPGEYKDLEFGWFLPKNLGSHYSLMARILDTPYDDAYVDGTTYFDVLGKNDEAQKNLIIIRKAELSGYIDLLVRSLTLVDATCSIELVPETTLDASLYSKAKISMSLDRTLSTAWERGGMKTQDLEYPAYQGNAVNRVVKFVSPDSQLQDLKLKAGESGVVRLKFEFFKPDLYSSMYTFDLIQKDKNGNIIGGQTFKVESPTELGPVEITPVPIVGGQYQLETDTTREYKTFKWLDGNGETLSEQNSVRVNPKATGNKYVLLAANEEGDVATGSINLEGNDGIKAVATPTAKSLEVTLKRPAPTGAMVTVTSVIDGGSKVTSGMPEGAEAITLDVSGLSNGVYVVSYSINSEKIDQKKVNIN